MSDYSNSAVRKVDLQTSSYVVSTIASVPYPWGIVVDIIDIVTDRCNLYVVSNLNIGAIYEISIPSSSEGISVTNATLIAGGTSAGELQHHGMIYMNATAGSQDGTLLNATFSRPTGIALDSHGNLYISDDYGYYIKSLFTTYYFHSIRILSRGNGNVSTLAGNIG